MSVAGLSGNMPVRTSRGYLPIRDVCNTDSVLGSYGEYSQVEELRYGRSREMLEIQVPGLPLELIMTPNQPVRTFGKTEMEVVPADQLGMHSMVVCPLPGNTTSELAWEETHEVMLDRLKILGAFFLVGRTDTNLILFDERFVNDTLGERIAECSGVSKVRIHGTTVISIADADLVQVTNSLFGITGTGPLPSTIYSLDRQSRAVFVGGMLDAAGLVQENGLMLLPVTSQTKILEILELLWKTGVPAAAVPAMPPSRTFSIIVLKCTPWLVEMFGSIERTKMNFSLPPDLALYPEYVTLRVQGVQTFNWENRPVYDLDVCGFSGGYTAGMVSVGLEKVEKV